MRFLHTADTHLGYQQYHKPEREQDFMDAFRQTIDAAIENDVDAVIHAGDLFQNPDPAPYIHSAVLKQLNRLGEADIPFLSIVGNHDRATRGQWIDLFEEASCAIHLDSEPTIIGDVAIYGIDYMGQGRRQQLDYEFEESDEVISNILVGHAQFAPLTPGNWDLREVLNQSNIDFDAVLLGDEHDRIETEIFETPVTYSGSTERTATDQQKPRTYNIVTVDGSKINIEAKELDTRQFEVMNIQLPIDKGLEYVQDQLSEKDIEDAVVRVNITGDGERVSPSTVEQYLQDECGTFYAIVKDDREFEREQIEIDVTFADPDEAIVERIEEVGLSATIRDLERDIRDENIAKTNLRQRAKTEVGDVLEDSPESLERPEIQDAGSEENESTEADDSDATDDVADDSSTTTPDAETGETNSEENTTDNSNSSDESGVTLSDFTE